MRCAIGVLWILLVSTQVVRSAGESGSGEIPMETGHGILIVEGRVEGRTKLRWIIDTGATVSVLSKSAAKKLHIHSYPLSSSEEIGVISKLELGKWVLKDQEFLIDDPPQALSLTLNEGVTFDGILGYPLLSQCQTVFDFQNGKIEFKMDGNERVPNGGCEVPMQCLEKQWMVTARLNDTHSVRLLLDTGASETLLTQETAARYGLRGVPMVHPSGAFLCKLTSFTLGSLRIAPFQVVIHTPPQSEWYGSTQDGILGRSFLNRYHVLLDPKHQRAIFTPTEELLKEGKSIILQK